MSDEIRISGIVEESIVDGPGLRYVLFTQGCPHHCKGCHNPTTHPFDGGRMVSPDWVFADVRKNPIVRGVTFSGGEPFVQSGKLAPLAERLRAAGYNLTSYTGYLYEELLADSRHMPLLRQLDEDEETVAAYMYVPKAKENRYWAATASFDDTPTTAVNEVETVSVVLNLQSPAMTFYKITGAAA